MTRLSRWRLALGALAAVGLLSLGGCAVALAPGYTIERQQVEVRFVAASPLPHLAIRAAYRLRNTGTQPLTYLEVTVPEEKIYRRQSLRVLVDGQGIVSQAVLESRPGQIGERIRISFAAPWPQKQRRELVLAYELGAGSDGMSRVRVADDAFFLQPRSWHPVLEHPKGAFAKGGAPPKKWELTVHVPEGFLAHASGRPHGMRKQSGEIAYRFEQRPLDFAPFVVAGRYQERRARARSTPPVIFWTRQLLPEQQASRAAERIAAAVNAYDTLFGLRGMPRRPVWIVESAAALADSRSAHLPEVALLSPGAWGSGIAQDDALANAEFLLAYTWAEDLVTPRFDVEPLPLGALAVYAFDVAERQRAGETARQLDVTRLLKNYDDARRSCSERAILRIEVSDAGCVESLARSKSGLFFMALEDRVGAENLRRALARATRALRGKYWMTNDLRAAVEAQSGHDLGEFFRLWLNQAGLPAEFRTRYEGAAKQTEK